MTIQDVRWPWSVDNVQIPNLNLAGDRSHSDKVVAVLCAFFFLHSFADFRIDVGEDERRAGKGNVVADVIFFVRVENTNLEIIYKKKFNLNTSYGRLFSSSK